MTLSGPSAAARTARGPSAAATCLKVKIHDQKSFSRKLPTVFRSAIWVHPSIRYLPPSSPLINFVHDHYVMYYFRGLSVRLRQFLGRTLRLEHVRGPSVAARTGLQFIQQKLVYI